MKALLLTLLALSLSGTLLGMILLAARRLTGGRLPRAFWYYAWLLVLLRLMVPLGYGIHLPERPQPSAEAVPQQTALPIAPSQGGQEIPVAGGTAPEPLPAEPDEPAPQSPAASISIPSLLVFLWLAGAAGSLLWHAVAYAAFSRRVRASLVPPGPEELAVFEALRKGGRVRLAASSLVDTPMLMGLLRPVVVLPQNGPLLSRQALSAVLCHELTHHRRGDAFYKWLVVLATALHWFNPLVHWLGKRIALDCELSCDEAVLATLAPEERVGYGDMLLALAARCRLPAGVTATTLCEEKRQLKARLQGILGYRKPTRAARCLALALGLLLACCACGVLDLAGEAASPSTPTTPEPETAVSNPYAALLSRYQEALALRQPEDYPDLPISLTNPYWAWTDVDSLLPRTGYVQMDLNGDGSPELLLGWLGNEFWNLNEGYVFAIYTLVDGQPILAGEGWERNTYVLGTDGYLYNCGSSGADRTEWNKYRFDPAAEGYLETVEHVSVPENGEPAIEVGDTWMASGASLPYIPFASSEIRDVLSGSTSFLYWAEGTEIPESKAISQVPALFSPDSDYAAIYQFAVLDLDGDGTSEVVLQISDVASDMGGYLVLRQVGGTVYGYPSHWRTFWYLKTDGTFFYSYSAGNEEGLAVVRFTETGMELVKGVCGQGSQFEFDTFLINGQPVSKAEYETAWEAQTQKPDAEWYEFTEENIRMMF